MGAYDSGKGGYRKLRNRDKLHKLTETKKEYRKLRNQDEMQLSVESTIRDEMQLLVESIIRQEGILRTVTRNQVVLFFEILLLGIFAILVAVLN